MLLGCLLKKPSLLELPQYPLTSNDFEPVVFHKLMFTAVYKLAKQGIQEATEIEVENIVKNHPSTLEVFQDNNFMDFIYTSKELCIPENFEYYYTTIKKFSLLRDLHTQGFDITEFYDELEDEESQNANLEKISIQDILNTIEYKSIELRSKYDIKYVRNEIVAGENTGELIEAFEEVPAFGAFLSSPYVTQLFMGWCPGHLIMDSSPSGVGKALTNSTRVPMADGTWKQVGEVKVGDYLLDREGNPTKVLGVFPQGKHQVYEVKFKDGRKVFCNKEHLWTVHNNLSNNYKKLITVTTESMINKLKSNTQFRFSVPYCEPVNYKEKNFFIPPYIMGLFLGNGSFRINKSSHSFTFSSPDSFLPKTIAKTMGWKVKKNPAHNYDWYFYNNKEKLVHVEDILKEYPELINAYSYSKFIPNKYLKGSIYQRKELLKGLLDTDGSVSKKKGRIAFFTTSEQMKDNVLTLCYSLGMGATATIDKRKYKYTSGICWKISIQTSLENKLTMFNYPPKLNKIKKELSKNKRRERRDCQQIIEINKLNYLEDMTCFIVNNLEHLFLCNDYIVTHNTRISVADLCGVSVDTLWDDEANDFISNLNYQGPGLFIHTELATYTEINPMFLACVSGVEVKHITMGNLTKEEKNRVLKAGEILQNNGLVLCDMADFTMKNIDRKIKESVEGYGMKYMVFDYVQLNSSITFEYRKNTAVQSREDLVLKYITTELKDMAEKYGIGIKTSSQLNGQEKLLEFPDESCLAGGKSQKNKLDCGSITLPVKDRQKEYKRVDPYIKKVGIKAKDNKPNLITYIYKSRFGEYADQKIKVWRYFDRGRFRNKDFICTDQYDNLIRIPKPVLKDF